MQLPYILLLLQETLPPPPAPTSSPDIDTARVIGIVIVSLGVVFLLALAAKPLVVRKDRPASAIEPEPESDDIDFAVQPVEHAAIIPFPSSEHRAPVAEDPHEDALASRLQWVTETSGRRRKLGDRGPAAVPPGAHRRTMGGTSGGGVLIPFQSATSASNLEEDRAPENSEVPLAPSFWQETERFFHQPGGEPEQVPEPEFQAAPEVDIATESIAPSEAQLEEEPPMSGYQNGHRESASYESLARDSRGEPSRPVDSILGEDLLETLQVQQATPPAATVAEVDDFTLAGITQSVRELLFCANVGELLHGFALYSDPFLFRFMDSTGLSEEQFRDLYGSVKPKDPEHWTRLARLLDVERLPDGRVEATATYRDVTGAPANGAERYRFVLSPDGTYWMIDDIRTVDRPSS